MVLVANIPNDIEGTHQEPPAAVPHSPIPEITGVDSLPTTRFQSILLSYLHIAGIVSSGFVNRFHYL